MVELDEIADLDLDRATRRGYPEAVFCSGKTVDQVAAIAAAIGRAGQSTLFTRADPQQAAAVLAALPDAHYDAEARLVAWPADPPPAVGGLIVVVTAGTSDLPVAREAVLTARHLGRQVELVVDVGVAGLHRILAKVELLRRARVIVVVAGMDGALPSVVAGLVSAPVVAVPTSVGYGAAFEGLAALLTMLNACAPGVAVVNIDNGYGAGHLAAQIAAPPEPARPEPARPEPARPEPTLPEPTLTRTDPARTDPARTDPAGADHAHELVTDRIAWLDCSAGVAGDMLLGALFDAGVPLSVVRTAVESVLPGSVEISTTTVTRAGMRATKADVRPLVTDPPHRSWADIEAMLRGADLTREVREQALAVFDRLAEAEARVHGVDARSVHFHEVGALDSIADVVGGCAGFAALGLDRLIVGRIALGSGSTRGAHGRLAVPVPAVLELSAGWSVTAGGDGELTTPTGMALVTTLAQSTDQLPTMTVDRVGVGAGTRDPAGRANVTRLVIGSAASAPPPAETMVVLESNVDDLDPRLWPGVLTALLAGGAADAWLTPILAKKGRPAHTLSVLVAPEQADAARDVVLRRTTSLGVRRHEVQRYALPRRVVEIDLQGGRISVKVGHRGGVVLQVTPEFEEVAAYAREHGRAEHEVMAEALTAAASLGYRAGSPLPD